jgi:hypothetical protein
MGGIYDIIDNTPGMPDVRKKYMKTAVSLRYDQILLPAYKKLEKTAQRSKSKELSRHTTQQVQNNTVTSTTPAKPKSNSNRTAVEAPEDPNAVDIPETGSGSRRGTNARAMNTGIKTDEGYSKK